jgi:hypothetical protein
MRTRRCRFCSSCDLSLYRTVEGRVLPGEDNRKSFLVEGKTEEIWSLSSHLQPSAFLWKRKIRIDVGEEQTVWAWRDSFTVQYCLLISWPFYSAPFRLFCFHFLFSRSVLSSALLVSAVLFTSVRAVTREKYIILSITRFERVNTKALLNYWILAFFLNWTILIQGWYESFKSVINTKTCLRTSEIWPEN